MIDEAATERDITGEPARLIAAPIQNEIGEQNCFLNVIIHCFFYTDVIKQFFLDEDIDDNERYHLLAEMKRTIEKYRSLTSRIYFKKIPRNLRFINPKEIRQELKYLFEASKLFQLDTLGEPSDVFYVFISAIHAFMNGDDNILVHTEQECQVPSCAAHTSFYLDIAEQIECQNCNEKSDLMKFPPYTFMLDVSAKDIMNMISKMQYLSEFRGKFFAFYEDIYSRITKAEIEHKKIKICSGDCAETRLRKNIILINPHRYFCFTIAWEEKKPKVVDICKLIYTIPEVVENNTFFAVYDPIYVRKYFLYGMICYCENHYISFYLTSDNGKTFWIYHDDMRVQKMNSYKEVVSFCIMNRFFPRMIFYQEKNAEIQKTMDIVETEFTDGDYFSMFNYSLKMDKQNAISYQNDESQAKIRKKNLVKTNDEALEKELEAMKKRAEERKKKQNEWEKEFAEGETSSNHTVPSVLEENKGEINTTQQNAQATTIENVKTIKIIDEDKLKEEGFRLMPYERRGNWVCKNCKNINNSSTFECLKCKTVDMEAFDMIENLKNSEKDLPAVKSVQDNKKKTRPSLRKKINIFANEPDMKKCINCGAGYYTKCENCKQFSKNTFQDVEDEKKDTDLKVEVKKTTRVHGIMKRKSIVNDKYKWMWQCSYCETHNFHTDFCKKCKRNKISL